MSGALQRFLDEYFAPTPAGQEPKLVTAVKSVTWFAVLVLVLIEIAVSIKLEGLPFDFSKVSLPFFNQPAATVSEAVPLLSSP